MCMLSLVYVVYVELLFVNSVGGYVEVVMCCW